MEVTLTRLLKDGERIAGAFGYWRENGRFIVFRAKAIVLATGGWGRVYKVTSNSWECTGDGVAMAYDAGAELMDMEMVQFHPTGMVWPPGVRGILVTEGVRGDGGILRNSEGERFMERYDPREEGPLLARRGGPLHLPRGGGRAAARRTAASTWTSRTAAPTSSSRSCPACTTSSWRWPTWTSPARRWRSARPSTTRWAACGWTRTPGRPACPGSTRRAR